MKYLNIIILLLLTTSFYSCNDYLDEIPEKSSGIVIAKLKNWMLCYRKIILVEVPS